MKITIEPTKEQMKSDRLAALDEAYKRGFKDAYEHCKLTMGDAATREDAVPAQAIIGDLGAVNSVRTSPTPPPQEVPEGWHVSWMGLLNGQYTCQIKRHDDDLDYLSDISFVSRVGMTQSEAYNSAVDIIRAELQGRNK